MTISRTFKRFMYMALIAMTTTMVGFTPAHAADSKTAIFAGGCFWSIEKGFEQTPGVIEAVSGFSGGHVENPDYHMVVMGMTGHLEAVKVTYDPDKITYEDLVMSFWHNIDPTDAYGQFCDKGPSYRTAVFFETDEEKAVIEKTRAAVEKQLAKPVMTQVLPRAVFYPAEDRHQDFYKKSPARYKGYLKGCQRVERLQSVWGHLQ